MQIIGDDNIKVALKRQVPRLFDFLIEHIDEIADIALGVKRTDVASAQSTCFSIIMAQIHSFTQLLVSNRVLLGRLNQYISSKDSIDAVGAAVFSRTLQFLIQFSNGAVLDKFPQRENLFAKILRHVQYSSVTNLVIFMTDDGRKNIITFLEDNKATEVLLGMIGDNHSINEKVFMFLANIVANVDLDSQLLSPFEVPETMEKILSIGLTCGNTHVSSRVFNLLFEVSTQCSCEEEEDTDPLYDTVFRFLISKVSDICKFIMSNKPFLSDKASAVELINMIFTSPGNIPECIISLCEFLFNQLFEKPANTFLHRSFLSVFDVILMNGAKVSDVIKRCDMKNRLIDVYGRREDLHASYWGVLYALVCRIADKTGDQTGEWDEFLKVTMFPIKQKLDAQYGGPLPGEQDSDSEEDLVFPLGKSELAAQKGNSRNSSDDD